MMAPARRRLEQLLVELAEICEALVAAAGTTTDLLLAGDTAGLLSTTAAIEALLQRVEQLAPRHGSAMTSLRAEYGLPSDATLSELVARLEPLPGSLDGAVTRLQRAMAALREIGPLNRQLLQQARTYVQFSLRVLAGALGSPTYVETGQSGGLAGRTRTVDLRG